ncbi:exosortase/archaeosortase family protein [Rubellicoccus peritrichatus]|uniref:Exosortase/archaeosortase family protein n=1 Tax=Rubellicoccus peritrichatus TaxID=3080537 RepID=A0AAQ3QVV5_9BACT|nr:exosortase/archaeosortase family protein [Puniceicoccus sp. CR14]WOO42033.1 exosortase/archaeosortase family protein [Puniceicoccus sp. CR14]
MHPLPIAILCLIVTQGIFHFIPSLVNSLLIKPSGILAAWFAGAVPSIKGNVIEFASLGLEVQVTEACSGTGFFSILLATIAYLLLLYRPSRYMVITMLLSVWPLAVIVNAARIVFSVASRRIAGFFLSPDYFPIVHQATGTLIFLTTLIALAFFINYLNRHGTRNNTIRA